MKRIVLIFGLCLGVASTAAAQTVTFIGPAQVKAADDFATRAFQDPWDMNQRTDFGGFLHSTDQPPHGWSAFTFNNGTFSGVTGPAGDANVFLLETGNPFAARLGKIGTNYPIDASNYKVLAVRMSNNIAITTGVGFATMQFYWNRETIYEAHPGVGQPDTTTQGTIAYGTAGWRVHLIDLSSLSLSGIAGSTPFVWGGTVKSLRFDPTQMANDTIEIDWARLVAVDPSLCRTITWSGAGANVNIYLIGSGTDNANLGALALNVANGSASPGCSPAASGYTYYAGALAPGTYRVAVTNSGATSVAPGNISTANWVVNDIPTMTITSPSEEGSSDDFATTVLGNPWDMDSLGDVDRARFVNNLQVRQLELETPEGVSLGNQRVLYGTSTPAGTEGFGDPHIGFLWNPGRGATARIDPSKYRILTLEMGIPRLDRNIFDGSIARIAWRVAGENGENVSDDVIFRSRAGANVVDKIIADMADRDAMIIEEGVKTGWIRGSAPNPGLDIFRIDPHEFTPATDFFIRRVKLAAFERATTSYTVQWQYSDSQPGTVDVFLDSNNSGFDGAPVCVNVPASLGSCTFSTSVSTLPSAYVYTVFRDTFSGGANENAAYAKWPIILANNAAPQLSVNRTRLNFGVANSTIKTSPQTVRVGVTSGSQCWTVTNPRGDIFSVSPASRNGSGTFTVSLAQASYAPGTTVTTTLTVGPCSGSTIENTATVTLSLRSLTSSSTATGVMDTPAEGQTVSGSLGVTGWAIDDVEVTAVNIWRDPVAGESASRIFIGTAVRVEDSRSDIAAAAPDVPFQYRAGWGYLLLTNFLPNGGNGAFRLHAYAVDAEGRETLLGSRTINGANSSATAPFGAIDTPGQGETISGTSYNNFGWVLARGPSRADPPGGGTVTVYIDGVPVGSPGGWTSRSDLSALFPALEYPGVNTALGVFTFNTTAYANGVHTIAWVVTATNGVTEGVGSRFFNIQNGSAPLTVASADAGVIEAPFDAVSGPRLGERAPSGRIVDRAAKIRVATGFVRPVSQAVRAGAGGTREVTARALDRMVVQLPKGGRRYEAYHVIDGILQRLPVGAAFDDRRGVFTWQPWLGFAGPHDFVFARDGRMIPVRVVLAPGSSGASSVRASGN